MAEATMAARRTARLGDITDTDIQRVQAQQQRAVDGGGAWQSWTRLLFTLQDLQRQQREARET